MLQVSSGEDPKLQSKIITTKKLMHKYVFESYKDTGLRLDTNN